MGLDELGAMLGSHGATPTTEYDAMLRLFMLFMLFIVIFNFSSSYSKDFLLLFSFFNSSIFIFNSSIVLQLGVCFEGHGLP